MSNWSLRNVWVNGSSGICACWPKSVAAFLVWNQKAAELGPALLAEVTGHVLKTHFQHYPKHRPYLHSCNAVMLPGRPLLRLLWIPVVPEKWSETEVCAGGFHRISTAPLAHRYPGNRGSKQVSAFHNRAFWCNKYDGAIWYCINQQAPWEEYSGCYTEFQGKIVWFVIRFYRSATNIPFRHAQVAFLKPPTR